MKQHQRNLLLITSYINVHHDNDITFLFNIYFIVLIIISSKSDSTKIIKKNY